MKTDSKKNSISSLFSRLVSDPWRKQIGFSDDIELVHTELFGEEKIVVENAAIILNTWLQKFQPCLFGRLAAKNGLITYCVLTEADLLRSDQTIKEKIQQHRLAWIRKGFEGKSSGFIIYIASPILARAIPNETIRDLAMEICSLYLLTAIEMDKIYTDKMWLEKAAGERAIWEWHVGVNYFSSHADKRWWHDHRIPGGIAFSMNSVGHMAKSGQLLTALQQVDELFDQHENDQYKITKITSLNAALNFAMRTIDGASEATSGKATWLTPLPENLDDLPMKECPADLPAFLKDKNFCSYEGYYHTDITLPSEYFSSVVERPDNINSHDLDFTYLFNENIENPDFDTMGKGRRIRGKNPDKNLQVSSTNLRSSRMTARLVERDNQQLLLKALS